LWCPFVLDPLVSPPQVAYAVGRAVGSAVTRNRVRRRLRSLIQAHHSSLAGGLYLIGASPAAAERSFNELAFDLSQLLLRLTPPPPG